jgi:hypothetical protein
MSVEVEVEMVFAMQEQVPLPLLLTPLGPPPPQIQGGQLELKGDQADLVINGVSLTETLQLIQDRLNMLRPNTALEAEWDQLRDLGLQYRKLEAELKEKQRAWEILKKQG